MKEKKIMELLENCGVNWDEGYLLDGKRNKVCNFLPEVVDNYRNAKTGRCMYRVRFHIGKENLMVDKILSLEELQKYDYMKVSNKCILGLDISINKIRRILLYLIQNQTLNMDEPKMLIDNLGWNIFEDGKMMYCAGTEAIGDGSNTNFEIEESIKTKFIFPIIDAEMDIMQVCKKFLKLECPTITTLILTSVIACLRSLFVKAEVIPHFSIYIYGTTGTFKTTVAKYFTRLYGDCVKLGGLFGELESTNFALEQMIDQVKDACVVIDDIAPCQKSHNTKEKKEKAASLIRKATSGVGTRKGIDGKLKELSYDVMMVFTAEELLETTSVMNRTVLLNADEYKISQKALRLMEKYSDFSVQLQRSIIEWVATDSERIVKMIREEFLIYREENKKSSKNTSGNRLSETTCILRVAWKLLIEWSEFISVECETLMDATKVVAKTMNRLEKDQYEIIRRMELQQQPENILLLLLRAIDNKEILVAENKTEFQISDNPLEEEKYFGVKHKGNLYLRDQKFIDFIKYKYKKKITKNAFRKILEKDGLLIKDKSKNRRKKLDGESFIVIDYEGLIELFRK